MYTPAQFRIHDRATIIRVLREFSFGSLIISSNPQLEAVHVPFLVIEEDPITLVGHVAKANPIASLLNQTESSLAIFLGPHGFISTQNYDRHPTVATWDYVAVHVYGRPTLIEDQSEVADLLKKLTIEFDPSVTQIHPEDVDREFLKSQSRGIVMFKLIADKVEAKAKLSQNRSPKDRSNIIGRLVNSEESEMQRLGRWIQEFEPQPSGSESA